VDPEKWDNVVLNKNVTDIHFFKFNGRDFTGEPAEFG